MFFFEAQPFTPQELPHGIVRHLHTARRQFILQTMQRQMRRLVDPLHDERPMRLQNALVMPAHLARKHRARRPVALMPLHCRGNGNAEPSGGRPATLARLDRAHDALAKIIG
ncbi:hypothetical protein A6U86_28020 [Rhizobium sp. AC27/96]|nr:hypothetical protein A6U86_28020 [Rhizobium sp. AC27/96]